ncbi:MAG: HAD-IB family hydrolase [Acidimicrobiales bacterium]
MAAFDLDGTLIRRGSSWQFLVAMVGLRRVALATLVVLPKLVLAAVLGGAAADDAKEALFMRTLEGLDLAATAPRAARFGTDHYRRHARADVRARLEWHRARGHLLVVVSASPELYVRTVGDELAVNEVVATRLEVGPDGRLTGRYDGHNCRGAQKVRRLDEVVETALARSEADGDYGESQPRPARTKRFLWAYGNSAGDKELLSVADVGVNVGRLGKLGRLHRFPSLKDLAP